MKEQTTGKLAKSIFEIGSMKTAMLFLFMLIMSAIAVRAENVAVQSDGKIVVVGSASNGSNIDFAVRRFNVDGTVDTSFGSKGRVLTNIGSSHDHAIAVVLQADSKIVVAGYAYTGSRPDFAVVRYNPNGTLDSTFDGDGIVVANFASYNSYAFAVAYRNADQKIIVSGTVSTGSSNDFATIRYNSNGSADSSFGFFGRKVTSFSGSSSSYSVATDDSGRVYISGRHSPGYPTPSGTAIARYNYNGSLDTSFDFDGKIESAEIFWAMTRYPDSRLVGATTFTYGSNRYFKVYRLNSTGGLDNTFGVGGVKISLVTGVPTAIATRADGRITVLGQIYGADFAIVRYNANGSQDTIFGSSGIVLDTLPAGIGSNSSARSIAYHYIPYYVGGKTVVSASGNNGEALIRYTNTGSRDATFGTGGVVTFNF